MSIRAEIGNHLPSGILASEFDGFGELAENIPSTGTHGAAYAYPSLTLPADNGKEIQGLITTAAVVTAGAGTLTSFTSHEDTSFDLVVTDDCTVEWTWSLYVDGVLDTAGLTGTVTIGGADYSPGFLASTRQYFAPSLQLASSPDVAPGFLASTRQSFAPTLSLTEISPGFLASTRQFFPPILSGGVPVIESSGAFDDDVGENLALMAQREALRLAINEYYK